MKKILSVLFVLAISLSVSGQRIGPYQFGTVSDAKSAYVMSRGPSLAVEYLTAAYASTITIAPNAYETVVKVASITGDVTFSITTTNCQIGDKLTLVAASDSISHAINGNGIFFGPHFPLGSFRANKWAGNYIYNGTLFVPSGQGYPGAAASDALDTARVTQLTDSSTAVTINSSVGIIKTVTLKTPVTNSFFFTVTNNKAHTTSSIQVSGEYTGTTATAPMVTCKSFASGSFIVRVTIVGAAGTNLTGPIRIHYVILNK